MRIFKKVLFVFPFLVFLILSLTDFNYIFKDFYVIFSFDTEIIVKQVLLCLFLLLSITFFVIFCALVQDWVYILSVALLAFFLPLLIFNNISFFVMGVGFVLVVVFGYFNVSRKMASYVDFKPGSLLVPSVVQIATSMLLVLSLALYLPIDLKIKEQGFVLPDSVIDASLKMTGQNSVNSAGLTSDQISQLKQNPELLEQLGLGDLGLDMSNLEKSTEVIVKNQVKSQIEGMVAPFAGFIPILIALLFFLSLRFLVSFLSLLLYPLVWFIFLILEKTNFIGFEKEMREVKKLRV